MPARSPATVLIAGVSTRAAAESAARAGFTVTAVDAFGDLDQHASVRSIPVAGRFTARGAARAAEGVTCDAVAYLASFENHPNAIGALAAGRALWGNPPAVVRQVRDPRRLSEALRKRGLPAPEVRLGPDARPARSTDTRWLMKPLSSGGGLQVRPWRPEMGLPRRAYLQEFIDGAAGSIVFVSAGGRAVPLGLSHQLVGERAFGAEGFQYCGNILEGAHEGDSVEVARDAALLGGACALADAVAGEFRLVGLNGVDFIVRNGAPHAIEANPRWCASMELVERAYGLSALSVHADACTSQTLPAFDLHQARRGAGATGKAIVYARRDTTPGDTRVWLDEPDHIRDIPRPGERIPAGRPVCTVFATGRDRAACHAALVTRAERVYEQLDRWNPDPKKIGEA